MRSAQAAAAKTAYLCCDNCGALVDYDYRLAGLGTNAGVTKTVFHQFGTGNGARRIR